MDYVFEIVDKSGRKIHLSKETWTKITTKHTNMSNKLEDIKKALTNPNLIIPHIYDENKRNYYLYHKLTKDYLLISVRYLNQHGYVVTAFITKKLMKI